ncbi:phage portal protein [Acidiphilium angustum]|uniref:phage portal protein n=1 Tax=Acidiphilium angustum TaxID=523 RepID=UPI00068E23FA|nr:phage portal protein [Acidiphilium angustum]
MALPRTPGAVFTDIPRILIDQVSGAVRRVFGSGPGGNAQAGLPMPTNTQGPMSQSGAQIGGALRNLDVRARQEPWMGPSQPLEPMAPRADVAGREWDYPVGYNINTRPREYEGLSFRVLRELADGLDLARLCIETRKDQMSGLTWDVVPRMKAGQSIRNTEDPRCQALLEFFRSPDRRNTWDSWMRLLMEEMLVTDAPSIYVRRTVGGDVYALEIIDGSTIKPVIDRTGRRPLPPEAGYQQILKGIPAIDYTADELLYFPRNTRPAHVYGCSPIQQLFTTINIALRREVSKLSFYTEGNIPEALVGVPATWTPDQIRQFQSTMDALTADQATRRRMYFIPAGTNYTPTRPVQTLDPQQDEWFARMICFAFSLPPLPLVQQMNRNTSETSYDAALAEGLGPTIVWLKGVMDHIITHVFGFPDIEFVLERKPDIEDAELEQRNIALVQSGIKSIDEVRAEMGLSPLGMGNAIMTPSGPLFIADLVRAHQQGMLAPPMQAPPDAGALGGMAPQTGNMPGAPPASPGAMPQPQSPLGVPPVAAPIGQAGAMPAQPGGSAATPPPAQSRPGVPANDGPAPRSDAFDTIAQGIPLSMLSAVGLAPASKKPDTKNHVTPRHSAPPQLLQELQHHESRAGKKHRARSA